MEKFIIDDRIFKVKFSCDVMKCKGACCTLKGAAGAPILDSEVEQIDKYMHAAEKYLSPENLYVIKKEGYLEGRRGDYSINSVNQADCVFSFIENGIAQCAFQKAYNNSEIPFPKPISCHLYPVRIGGKKRNIIRYDEINECCDALSKGEKENVSVFEFAKDSIIREYGKDFYADLYENYFAGNFEDE